MDMLVSLMLFFVFLDIINGFPLQNLIDPLDMPNKELEKQQIDLSKDADDRFFDLDMILKPKEEGGRHKRAAPANTDYRWPNHTVPYVFDTAYPITETMKKFAIDSIAHIQNYSCIVFKERSTEQNYLNITAKSTGCFAYLGYVRSGGQELNLASNCNTLEVVVHEIMHALGFFHEHNRPDRDEYVVVNYTNILNGAETSFKKFNLSDPSSTYGEITLQNISYDKQSVMQYHRYAFTKHTVTVHNRDLMTIYSKTNHMETLGNPKGLSDKDIMRLDKLYECNVDIDQLIRLKNGITTTQTTATQTTQKIQTITTKTSTTQTTPEDTTPQHSSTSPKPTTTTPLTAPISTTNSTNTSTNLWGKNSANRTQTKIDDFIFFLFIAFVVSLMF